MKLVVILALAPIFGCNDTPAPPVVAPSTTVEEPVVAPAIVGTVLLSTTDMPPPKGGIVYLEDGPKEPDALTTATVDIFHKQLTPFIAVITTGGAVTFKNLDPLAHHIFTRDLEPQFDTGTLEQNVAATKTFNAPGVISLLCNIHPEMLGYLLVIPSTYFGPVRSDGKYAIHNVPPGTYKLTAWAPRVPTMTQSVTVARKDIVTADFTLHPTSER